MTRKQSIGRAFGGAARSYEDSARVQRLASEHLADRIAALPLPPRPRVLEIGCGTGFLTAALRPLLPDAQLVVSDLSPAMVATCRAAQPDALYLVMDGERPCFAHASFDLVCCSLVAQWFEDLDGALAHLCRLLRPGGHLAFSTLLSDALNEWRQAHDEEGLAVGAPDFAAPAELQHFSCEGARLALTEERVVERYDDGAAFVRTLKSIGAGTPRPGRKPLSPQELKLVLRRFEAGGSNATYHLGYGLLRRPGVQHDAA
jgi:malonyl-CoA O-methyltransferase